MNTENWHSSFNPQKFLAKVNIEDFIEHNETYNQDKFTFSSSPCILCSCKQGKGIILNDKSFLCKKCFSEVSSISYPEQYEKARRNYIKARESRQLAKDEFTKKYGYTKQDSPLFIIAILSLALLFFNVALIFIPMLMFTLAWMVESNEEARLQEWVNKKKQWEIDFPEPSSPVLKHFHDPSAKLTQKDREILKIFNNWPGYPPFWGYLREVVLNRDKHRCQVSGCPSRVSLHIHHKIPVSKGGQHLPSNLITLCEFHHALEPDEGHLRIWGTVKSKYYTVVRPHKRRNPKSLSTHLVKAHVRRLELVSEEELNQIKKYYMLSCPTCGSDNISISVTSNVVVECLPCNNQWEGLKALTEETGPWLAETMMINKNMGSWQVRWDMLTTRKDNISYKQPNVQKTKSKNRKSIKSLNKSESPLCPKCNAPMKVLTPRRGQRWKRFWSCTKYKIEGCDGTRRFK